jgi:hypothetical protein
MLSYYNDKSPSPKPTFTRISNIVLCDAAILKKKPNNANIAAKT